MNESAIIERIKNHWLEKGIDPATGRVLPLEEKKKKRKALKVQIYSMWRDGCTLKEIGESIGITKQRVQQIVERHWGRDLCERDLCDVFNSFTKQVKVEAKVEFCGKSNNGKISFKKDPGLCRFYAARQRALRKGVPFKISISDIDWPEYCPVLGLKLRYEPDGHRRDDSPSIDRVFPELGYIPGNVFVISERANRIKNNGSWEEHLKIVKYMRKYLHNLKK